jgi:hypothetical protein
MAKIDKSQYTKAEWKVIKEQRRQAKLANSVVEVISEIKEEPIVTAPVVACLDNSTAFVMGNGTSRSSIDPKSLRQHGKTYGCNALYRTFAPDYLVAVDVKMVLEIAKAGYQHHNPVWTNPNKSYQKITNLNFFHPSKGWSSGPTALWLASQHKYQRVFILGFDYKGLNDGVKFNNLYADTVNYKKSTDGATFFGNWLRQTASVIKENPHIQYYRVIASDNYCPEELNKFSNLKTIFVDDFKKMFNL